ncbi:MAG: alpha/beta hydrolase [Deltaproteobacteria bacterium]|nr:alpha/beta hydrolase [Deltaproteobacteria bacterium]MBW1736066.1 alpha/beta hydrolase [Deltaproteobacteria bacterium]MBW1908100.1 alpha/beta hydrolase [Deltaproteobacteria bacterium]MBW2032165.1 alpha/beta hydrolase [Deltaproteobacteria bacterium]MBW2113249.1 alpha/beta hydrolase [Deltaproteobacteria bacterium]
MIDISEIDYSVLDRPEILMSLFHPRPEWGEPGTNVAAQDILIQVESDVVVGGRFHMAAEAAPNILFFHGNGEIVADYDQMGPMYNQMDINFLPVDYRGYGRSTGEPTVTAMMRDCHMIFAFVEKWLQENRCSGPLIVMGRSLGSASALELTASYKIQIHGLILESGFAYAGPLLRLLGVNVNALGFKEEEGFRNVDKIRSFNKSTLIIHAEKDHIIPFSDGQALYNSCQSVDKTLLQIPGANHNDIFLRGLSEYMAAVKTLVDKIAN